MAFRGVEVFLLFCTSAPFGLFHENQAYYYFMSERGHPMNFNEATQKALQFRRDRDWEQFHNPKDLAASISIEAAELLEVFQWSGTNLEPEGKVDRVEEELADVMIYCIYLADRLGIDIPQAISDKIDSNAAKYPVDKSRGLARKYTEL